MARIEMGRKREGGRGEGDKQRQRETQTDTERIRRGSRQTDNERH